MRTFFPQPRRLPLHFRGRFCYQSTKFKVDRCHWFWFPWSSPEGVQSFFFCLRQCLLCDVVDEEGSNGRSVVGSSDRSEVLLSSSVPNLQFEGFIPEEQIPGGKLYSEGDLMIFIDLLFDELGDNTALADSCILLWVPVSPTTMNLSKYSKSLIPEIIINLHLSST